MDNKTIESVNIKTMHHKNAPDTEVAAAEKVAPKVGGLRLMVLQFLHRRKVGGATGERISKSLDQWLYSVKPRLTELARMGLVKDSGKREVNSRNRREIIWEITEEGRSFFNE